MKIGVGGAGGHLGRAVASELLQRPDGHPYAGLDRPLIAIDFTSAAGTRQEEEPALGA
jgi:nucleoside-diphosphate-sugar epimerase